MKILTIIVVFLFSELALCNGFSVLVAVPTVIKSLHGLFSTIALGLAEAGHNVTFVTPHSLNKQHPNLELYKSPPQINELWDSVNVFEVKSASNISILLDSFYPIVVKSIWSDDKINDLWKRRKEFDLFITMSYYSEIAFPFLMDSSATFVQVCTPGVESVSMSFEGNWLPPSVVPSILNNYDEYMTFWERVLNFPGTFVHFFLQRLSTKTYFKYMKEYITELDENENYYDRVALTLINGHFALDGPVPLLPSQIEIGTINAKKAQPLENVDKKLAKFVEGSGDAGIIYFSLGSIAKGTDIPKNAKDMFLEAFRKIPQRVLWKYEGDDLDLPPNVLTQKWMPQQDILGHPKTRVFISHCGNLGTQEAKYHGVPVLGVPIAFDQPRNAARMERKGYALVINWENLSVDNIVEKLNILINDKSYKERLTTVSRILQDQKDSPLERAIWWLEYVVRHKGAPHLNYAGRRLSLFQYIMLDVLLFWFAVLAAIVLVIVFTVRALCCRKSSMKENGQQKKKRQ